MKNEDKETSSQNIMTHRFDYGVCPIWTTSPGPAQSMGRHSFIKWHEKEENNHHLQKQSYTSILENG